MRRTILVRLAVGVSVLAIATALTPWAEATTIFWSFLSENGRLLDRHGGPLSAGDPSLAGDGTLLELLAWVGDDIRVEAQRVAVPEAGYNVRNPAAGEDHPNYELLAVATVGDGMESFPEDRADGRFSVRTDVDAVAVEDALLVIRFWDESLLWYNEIFNPEVPAWRVPPERLFTSIDPVQGGSEAVGAYLGRGGKLEGDWLATIPEPGTLMLIMVTAAVAALGRHRG